MVEVEDKVYGGSSEKQLWWSYGEERDCVVDAVASIVVGFC